MGIYAPAGLCKVPLSQSRDIIITCSRPLDKLDSDVDEKQGSNMWKTHQANGVTEAKIGFVTKSDDNCNCTGCKQPTLSQGRLK
jgi:hypothetical protein